MPAIERSAHSATRLRSGLVAVGGLLTLAIITLYLQRYGLSTLAVEHAAVRGWLDGDGLYAYREPGSQAGAAQPPAAAMLLAPLTLLPLRAAGWLLALAGVAALLLTTLVVAGPVARRHGRRRGPFVLAAASLALLAEPVRAAIGLGRPELLILALLAADIVGLRRAARTLHLPHRTRFASRFTRPRFDPSAPGPLRRVFDPLSPGPLRRVFDPSSPGPLRRAFDPSSSSPLRRAWANGSWAGAGTGLAAALSPTALLFVVYLLVTRQRRAAVTALATAAAVTVAALVAAPAETLAWYGTTMWELDRPAPISDIHNQSLAGAMARLYDFPAPPVLVWFSFGILLLAVGLIRARSAHSDNDEVAAFTLIGLTAAVAGPVTTAAESLWLLPAVLVLADAGLRRRLGGRLPRSKRLTGTGYLVAAALGYLTLVVTPEWSLIWNVPAFTLILLVNALPWRHGTPALPTRQPVPARRAAIPLPRGG
ncbi:glycosyltransferase 87 family protein [Actinoplanes sp. NEAU-A12]|uniref:Glycosyltransferase 87 family protein n=1 Tax=Actinoplanes sandaracinus TaxID=3045177 RepID=A0ABT6WHB9_9ACTN|nr:glycosyltransferase 87 family protein [Actinoplanes sandaracinus]MDI6099126.1 glycosyltransferase 87 family protein [Actinoplanes sandaracinus]